MYCEHSKYIDKGIEQYLICSISGKYCCKQRFCRKRNKVAHTDDWDKCPNLLRKENSNGKSKEK